MDLIKSRAILLAIAFSILLIQASTADEVFSRQFVESDRSGWFGQNDYHLPGALSWEVVADRTSGLSSTGYVLANDSGSDAQTTMYHGFQAVVLEVGESLRWKLNVRRNGSSSEVGFLVLGLGFDGDTPMVEDGLMKGAAPIRDDEMIKVEIPNSENFKDVQVHEVEYRIIHLQDGSYNRTVTIDQLTALDDTIPQDTNNNYTFNQASINWSWAGPRPDSSHVGDMTLLKEK